MRGDGAVDDAPEVRADLVRAAIVRRVASRAPLEQSFAGADIRAGKQRADGLRRSGDAALGRTG